MKMNESKEKEVQNLKSRLQEEREEAKKKESSLQQQIKFLEEENLRLRK